jgi:hypothetical protein
MCNQLASITPNVDLILSIRFHTGEQTLHVGVSMGNECHWQPYLCALQDLLSFDVSRDCHIHRSHQVLNF